MEAVEETWFHSGRLPVHVDPVSPSHLSSEAAFHLTIEGLYRAKLLRGPGSHLHFQAKTGGVAEQQRGGADARPSETTLLRSENVPCYTCNM